MTEPFAKIFETDDIGQILVFKDTADDGCPCIRTMFGAPEMGSIATVSSSYSDTDEGEAARDQIFTDLTLDAARQVASSLLDWKVA